jgi:hypothetical protein
VSQDKIADENLKVRRIDDYGNKVYYDTTISDRKIPYVTRIVTPSADTITTKPTIYKESTQETNLPIIPGLYKTPRVTTKVDIRNTNFITNTAVNPCKKGCGGSSTPAGNSSGVDGILGAAELALLKKIDATTVYSRKSRCFAKRACATF